MNNLKKNILNYPFNLNEKNILIDELNKKIIYIDQNISSVKILKKKKIICIKLTKKINSRQKKILKNKIDKIIKQSYSRYKIPDTHIIVNKFDKLTIYNKNPMKQLIKNKEVFKEADGIYSFGNKMTKLINAFENEINKISNKFKASHYHFPSLMSVDLLSKLEYLKNNSENIGFVTHLIEDLNKTEIFRKKIKSSKNLIYQNKENFSHTKAMLSPTVCQHLYCVLSNTSLNKNIVATASGNCFRYESKNMKFLERLWNFSMREIIFIGSEKHVREGLVKSRLLIQSLLDKFGLSYKIETATDPFFGDNTGEKSLYQKSFKLKYEVKAKIPFNHSSLSIGSFNNALDFFGKKLNITNKYGKNIYSGCVGFGNERFAYSFICQYGINEKKWPEKVKKLIK